MYEVLPYVNKNSPIYIKTEKEYKGSVLYDELNEEKYTTPVKIPNNLTKPYPGDMIDVVEFNGELVMVMFKWNSVNPVFSVNTKENGYKKTTVDNGYINGYAYITFDQFKNETQVKDKIYILKGYVPSTEDGITVQEKQSHPLVVMKNFEWWLQKIDQLFIDTDQVLEVKVNAQIKNFNYNNKYDPSFWVNPSQKNFEYQFIKASDMTASSDTNPLSSEQPEEVTEQISKIEETTNNNFVNTFSKANNNSKTKTSLKTFVDEHIKLRNEILGHLMNNPDCEQYLITLQQAGIESSVDCLHTLITSIMIEYYRNN